MRSTLATTRPLNYGGQLLGKTMTSLRNLAKRYVSLPLTLNHGADPIGEVRSLSFEVRDGVGYLTGVVPDNLAKLGKGLSLQFRGIVSGSSVDVRDLVHATITDTPRDSQAILSDNDGDLILFQDSEDTPPDAPATEAEAEAEATADEGTEIEITDAVLSAIRDRIMADPTFLARLTPESAGNDPTPVEEPSTPVPATPVENLKIIIKPHKPQVVAPKAKPARTIQQPFRSL
jgi:hypothetical protein